MVAAAIAIIALVKNAYLVPVETVKAILRAHPDKSIPVLRNGIAAALREALPQRAMLEPDGLVLREGVCERPNHYQNHETNDRFHSRFFEAFKVV